MKPLFQAKDLAVAQACAAAVLFLAIPVVNAMGVSSKPLVSVLHGLGATLTFILSCQLLHQAFPLMRGKEGSASRLELTLLLTNVLVLFTIVFGNWLYIGYRAPDGVQQWLLHHQPSIHTIGMEFKEFVSLLPLPLGIAASFLVRRFRDRFDHGSELGQLVGLLITLMWICMLVGFAFGIGITKIRMV